jgi:opacity protein-like surface antigen
MSISRTLCLSCVLALGYSGALAAQDRFDSAEVVEGFYAGAGLSQSRFSDDEFDFDALDDEDNTWKLVAGYRFADHFALEGSYIDFGEAAAPFGLGLNPVAAEAKGFAVQAIGMLPVPYVDLFAKVGIARMDAEGVSGDVRLDDETTEFAYGAGAQWRWNNLALRAEYEKFDTDVIGNLDLISLGATYTFNLGS